MRGAAVTGENTEGHQEPNPLAAERERLRQAGYTEAEISQILIARATGGGAPRDALPQGALSNALGSIAAVGAYAAGLFTSIPHDLATMLDPSSKASARSGAFVSLLFKGVVVGVLAFAAWQEWQQHVISQTEIAELQARKIEIEAENAKALNEAQVKKIEAEAAVAKEVNEAQAAKLKAEAGAAEQVAAGEKAKPCNERLQLLSQNIIPDELSSDLKTAKPGTATARMFEKYNKDCGAITGATPDATVADEPPRLTDAQKQDLKDCVTGDGDTQIRGCTGMLDGFPHGLGKLTVDLMYFARASGYRAKHQDREAVADLDKAIGINPNNAEAYNLRGVANESIDTDKAVADFTKAIELDPQNWRAYHNRGLVYSLLKNDEAHGKADQAEADRIHPPDKPASTAEAPPPPPKAAARPLATDTTASRDETKSSTANEATPAPAALRTPSGFHCNKASMSMGSDWVICSSPQLMDAEARLEEAYAATRAYRGKSVGSEQVEWIKHFPTNCGLPYHGRPTDEQISERRRLHRRGHGSEN